MMRPPQRTPARSRFTAFALFASLFVGQLAFGPGLLAAFAAGPDTCCGQRSPGEQAAPAAHQAHRDGGEGSCPEDGSDERCPPGCDDCPCCPGAVVAVVTAPLRLALRSESPPGGCQVNAPPGDPASGIPGRIFRPPQPAPA